MASPQGGTGPASVITGLIVAAAAVVPLVWFASSEPTELAEPAVEEPAAIVVTPAPEPEPTTGTIVVVSDPVVITDLPESVVRALESAGNVRRENESELELPESVVGVLAEHDVVLRVAEEPAP